MMQTMQVMKAAAESSLFIGDTIKDTRNHKKRYKESQ